MDVELDSCAMSTAIDQLPPRRRQIIAFGNPTPVSPPRKKGLGAKDVVDLAVLALPLGPAVRLGKYAYDEYTARHRVEPERTELPDCVVRATAADDLGRLKFPPGHPTEGCTYALNPVRPEVYIPFHQYHRVVLREKVAELFTLLAALRAEQVHVEVARGALRSGSLSLGALLPTQVPVQVNVGASAARSSGHVTSFEARFDGSGAPRVPRDSLKWFEHEPEWRALSDARMDHGLTTFRVSMQYVDAAAVTATLGIALQGAGYSLGGEFQQHEAEEWHLSGTFARKPLFGW